MRLFDAWPRWRGGALALIGPSGSGKTHLASAWQERTGAQRVNLFATVTTEELARLEGGPVLVEDADGGPQDRSWGEALFHLINMAARPGGGLLVTARTTPATWPAALPDLRSRLNALPVAVLGEPDDAVLQALMERFFLELNIKPDDDLIPYLANRIERSVEAARHIVAKLDEKAGAEHRPVNKALARRILDSGEGEPHPQA